MRFVLLVAMSLVASVAAAETVIVRGPAAVVTAQDHAVVLARRGTLVHSHCGQYEGIGTGSSPEAAKRACCFYGKRQIVEEGVAYSPTARRWFAVIRYR
jgi:tRNA G37 N-methylase TrmD